MNKKEMRLCQCGNPVIGTMMFIGSEYYCIDCGETYGMFDGFKYAELSPILEKRLEENKKWFNEAMKHNIGGGCQIQGCKTCNETREPHLWHCTDEEKDLHEKSVQMLKDRIAQNK